MAALLASTHKGTFLLALFPHTLFPETPSRSPLDYCGLMLWLQGTAQQHPWEQVFHPFLLCVHVGDETMAVLFTFFIMLFLSAVY